MSSLSSRFFNLFSRHTVGVVYFEYGVVRAIVLSDKNDVVRLVSSGEELLPEDSPSIFDPLFEKRSQVVASVKRTLSDVFGSNRPGRVIVLVPDAIVTRFVTRVMKSGINPSFDHNHSIRDHISAQLQLLGIDPVQVSVDYRVIHESTGLYEIEVSCLLKKEKEMISSLMKSIGYPGAMVTSPLGMLPSSYYSEFGQAQLFIDIGEKESVIACGSNGFAVSRTVVPVGVSQLAEAVSRFHGVLHKEARNQILEKGFALGLRDDSGLQSELLLTLQPIFRETELFLREHGGKSYRFPSERFVVTSGFVYGAGAGIRGIGEVLSMRTRIPFNSLDVTPHLRNDDDPLAIPASKLIHYAPLVLAGMVGLKK